MIIIKKTFITNTFIAILMELNIGECVLIKNMRRLIMALIQDELKITKLKELIDMKLALPSYQRPYSWSVKSTNTLFIDTYERLKMESMNIVLDQ